VQLHPLKMTVEACLTGSKGTVKTAPSQAPGERSQLGGHRQPGTEFTAAILKDPTQESFAATVKTPGAIGISRIHQGQPTGDGFLKRGRQFRVITIRVVAPKQLIPPRPGAKTDPCHTIAPLDAMIA